MCTATGIHCRPQATNETKQENIQRFDDLVIQAIDTDPTAVTCLIAIILFIRYIFNKEIKKQVAGTQSIQTLRHAMILVKEAEIKLKKYEGLNDDDPSGMPVSTMPQGDPTVMAIQGQGIQTGNQNAKGNVARLNWKVNLACYKCGKKRNLARECPYTGNAAGSQPQSSQTVNPSQTKPSGSNLLVALNPSLSQTIAAEIPISTELRWIFMSQINKAQQDNKPLRNLRKYFKNVPTESDKCYCV